MPVPITVFSDLLERLYAATLDEAEWQEFLTNLCEATQSINAFLIRNHDGMGRRVLALGGSDRPEVEEGYTTSDPVRDAFMRRPRSGLVEVEDFLPHAQLLRSEIYPAMAAVGITYGTCLVPSLSVRRYDLIAMWRGGDRPRLEPDFADLLTMLLPHLRNALKIHQALGISRERAQNAEAILDASSTACLLVSASGTLQYMNEAAQRLVVAGDGLTERKSRITPAHAEQSTEFCEQIAAAASRWDHPGGAMMLDRAGGKRPLQILFSAFHRPDEKGARRVLVLATDPDRQPRFPDAMLQQMYGFTPAETEIATGLVTGFSPEGIASIRGSSVGTVRSQIKSLLLKTDTRRQVDLVRLLCTLPEPPALRPQ